jgi:hypothetical protein
MSAVALGQKTTQARLRNSSFVFEVARSQSQSSFKIAHCLAGGLKYFTSTRMVGPVTTRSMSLVPCAAKCAFGPK